MEHIVTLQDQLEVLTEAVQPLLGSHTEDLPGAHQQCKSAIAECEALLAMLNKEKSDIEYEMLENDEQPNNYWDI